MVLVTALHYAFMFLASIFYAKILHGYSTGVHIHVNHIPYYLTGINTGFYRLLVEHVGNISRAL